MIFKLEYLKLKQNRPVLSNNYIMDLSALSFTQIQTSQCFSFSPYPFSPDYINVHKHICRHETFSQGFGLLCEAHYIFKTQKYNVSMRFLSSDLLVGTREVQPSECLLNHYPFNSSNILCLPHCISSSACLLTDYTSSRLGRPCRQTTYLLRP